MVELAFLQVVRDIVAIGGVVAGFTYYVITIRNQSRTRQAQLLMNLYESYRSTESRRQSLEIHSWKWKDPNDFFEKYGQQVNPDARAITKNF